MVELPPVRFSTMKVMSCWVFTLAAIRRAKVSTPPPGATGTTMRIGRVGKPPAHAATSARTMRRPWPISIDGVTAIDAALHESVLNGCPAGLYHCGWHRWRYSSQRYGQRIERCAMAAENAIPTIDLTPLRSGSDAEKRDVACQIDAACKRHRLLPGDRPRRSGRPHHEGAPARDRLLRAARRREDEGAAAAVEDQPRLQLGRRPRNRLFDGRKDAARHPGGVRLRPGPADLAAKVDPVSAQMYAPNIWPQQPDDFARPW